MATVTGVWVVSSPAGAATGSLSVTPLGFNFEFVPLGTVDQRELLATNDGDVDVAVTAVRFEPLEGRPGPTQFSIAQDRCSATVLAPGASCSVTIAFAPVDHIVDGGYLLLEGDVGARVPVMGIAATPGRLVADRDAIDAGAVGAGAEGRPVTVTVENRGSTAAQLGEVILSGHDVDDFRVVEDGCSGALLVYEETCSVTVVFAPGDAGLATAAMEVPNDGVTHPVVALSGEGLTRCEEYAVDGRGAVVRLVYIELLDRCPDAEGFAYWVDRLDRGTAPDVFARSIAATPEAVGQIVDDAYLTMLGRRSDPSGRAYWITRLQADGRYDGLLADLGSSEEYWGRSGADPAGFVTRTYERLLDRHPDPAGLRYWVDRLASGTGRRALVLLLANEDEPLGRVVTLSYREILDRNPTPSERAIGVAHLRSTGDRSALYAQLVGHPEFAIRAGTFPS